MREKENLTLLGNQQNNYETDYNPDLLETFVNKHPENDYFVKFNCPEFTSLCPITGQPDFANIIISYVPGERMVESKSLKLYLFSFRNHGAFHEDCVNIIMKDLIRLMNPKYIEVTGIFTPRGGISLGGNVQTLNSKPDGSAWQIAVEDPKDKSSYIGVLSLRNQAAITSGGYERYFEKNGKKYHHIIDPKTGYPSENGLSSVTIVSKDGTLADGLSTSLFIMGRKKATTYWKKHTQAFDTVMVEDDGTIWVTEGIADVFSGDSGFKVIHK